MTLHSDMGNMLDPILSTFDDALTTEINGQLVETYMSGQAEMITWGKTKAGVPIAYEGPPIQGAIDWAEKHGATLVKGMNEETKKRLASTISQGIENKRGIPGLSKDIKNTFTDMSKHRSELIARTETAKALSEASLDTMEDMGIDGKEWVTAGDDLVSDECSGNEAEGVIPVNQAFSGGVMAPPQHPDCRCVIAPSKLPTKARPPVTKEPLSVKDLSAADSKKASGDFSKFQKSYLRDKTLKPQEIIRARDSVAVSQSVASDAARGFQCFQVEGKGAVQAMVSIGKEKNAIWIKNLSSAPWNAKNIAHAQQVRGAGSRLVKTVFEEAVKTGIGQVKLIPLRDAIPFYQKIGFTLSKGEMTIGKSAMKKYIARF